MNVPQAELNALAVLALRVKNAIWNVKIAPPAQKSALLEDAAHLAANLQTRLDRAGADNPTGPAPTRSETPLALLDTPANLAYHDALRHAHACALAVDRERFGPTIGTDGPAQAVELILRTVETELYGPAGHRE